MSYKTFYIVFSYACIDKPIAQPLFSIKVLNLRALVIAVINLMGNLCTIRH